MHGQCLSLIEFFIEAQRMWTYINFDTRMPTEDESSLLVR